MGAATVSTAQTSMNRLASGLRHPAWQAAGLFAIALLPRLWVIHAVRPDASAVFMFDPTLYYSLGASLASGDGFSLLGEPTAAVSPGYPGFLAAAFVLLGTDIETALVANAVIGALACVLTMLTARELFGDHAGVIAGVALALLPGQLLLTSVLLAENLATLLVIACVYLSVRWMFTREGRSGPAAIALGLLAAAAALTRGEMLPWIIVLALAAWIPRRSMPAAARVAVVPALIVALSVGAWVARNAVTMDSPVIATSTVSNGLYISLGPYFDRFVPPEVQFADPTLPPQEYETTASREQAREALEYARDHPLEQVERVPKRLWKFVKSDDGALRWIRIDPAAVSDDEREALSVVSNIIYWPVLIVALGGLPFWLTWRDSRHLLVVLTVAMWTAIHSLIFLGDPHYHAPIMPLVCVMAAGGALAIVGRLKRSPSEDDGAPPG